MRIRTMAYWAIGAAIIGFSALNASWIAPKPEGALKLVANRGVGQVASGATGQCAPAQIKTPEHPLIEQSLRGIEEAFRRRADWVVVDLRQTKDGQIVLFADEAVDCRTDGKGRVADLTLAQLQRLDIGHGYTADGGKSYPLRGDKGVAAMPSLDQLLRTMPRRQFVFRLHGNVRDAVIATFARAGIKIDRRYAFTGISSEVAAMRSAVLEAWFWDNDAAAVCNSGYLRTGWLGISPKDCRGQTIVVPIDSQFWLWGWPNRFLKRMADVYTRVVIAGPSNKGAVVGLTTLNQINDVPADFKGFLLLEDVFNQGPAIRP